MSLKWISPAARRSSTWSPMATPMRHSGSSSTLKRPNGRFWTGKSLAGSLADSTQLRKAGSWV
ncbi:hypothetical protein Y695_03665 [Hydrogenophaga sp. T4]|nr:hypothetical protein Y695_03665 [Hydrogenophaga sp. T4]